MHQTYEMPQKTVANESWHGMYRAGEMREHLLLGGHNLKMDLKKGCFLKTFFWNENI